MVVAACLWQVLPAPAAPTGQLSLGITPGGGATNQRDQFLDWYLPVGGGVGDFTTGGGSVSWSGGTLTFATNPYGKIADLPITALQSIGSTPISNFIQFDVSTSPPNPPGSGTVQTFPAWDLTGTGPGAPLDAATDPPVNTPCSVHVTSSSVGPYLSPLIITRNNFGGVDVRLDLILRARDANGSATWTGVATAQISNITPAQFATAINAGQTVNLTSWSLDMSSSVPEPFAAAVPLSQLLWVGLRRPRRQR
jgi:hypothetical protein